jgi:hypothetical protein
VPLTTGNIQQFNETQDKADRLKNQKAKMSPLLSFRRRYEVSDEVLSEDGLETSLRLIKLCRRAQQASDYGLTKPLPKPSILTADAKSQA